MKRQLILIFLTIGFLSCERNSNEGKTHSNTSNFEYIQKMNWTENQDSLSFYSHDFTIVFGKNELPLEKIMVIPTASLAYLDELDLLSKITGISQKDFIFNPKVQQLIETGKIKEIGSFNELFVEKIILNKPDLMVSTSSPTLAKFHELIKKEGIKIIYLDEYEETNPIAKAEYIKLFGKLFGKESEANQIFDEIVKNYGEIQSIIRKSGDKKPTVFANQIYGDVWYMPGGKSFQAGLIKDAGGDYLWSSDLSSYTLNLSFEAVFAKANDADVWINAGDFPSKKTLLATNQNYEWFSAFKKGSVYNLSKRTNEKGANDYFETGTARPDLVLKDLAKIFHPELFPQYELYFYKKLE